MMALLRSRSTILYKLVKEERDTGIPSCRIKKTSFVLARLERHGNDFSPPSPPLPPSPSSYPFTPFSHSTFGSSKKKNSRRYIFQHFLFCLSVYRSVYLSVIIFLQAIIDRSNWSRAFFEGKKRKRDKKIFFPMHTFRFAFLCIKIISFAMVWFYFFLGSTIRSTVEEIWGKKEEILFITFSFFFSIHILSLFLSVYLRQFLIQTVWSFKKKKSIVFKDFLSKFFFIHIFSPPPLSLSPYLLSIYL